MLSPAGVFSGTSGKQKTTQEWISAKLNCPTKLSLFMGLYGNETGKLTLLVQPHGPLTAIRLWLYLSWSMLCVRWWRDRGLIWYRRTWHVLGCNLGVTYACRVPYCPSMDLTYKRTMFFCYYALKCIQNWIQITNFKKIMLGICFNWKVTIWMGFDSSVTFSSSLVVLAWHLYVANRKLPFGCWKHNKESHTFCRKVKTVRLSKKKAHLWITFTETDNSRVLIHIQQIYWDVTLHTIHFYAIFSRPN